MLTKIKSGLLAVFTVLMMASCGNAGDSDVRDAARQSVSPTTAQEPQFQQATATPTANAPQPTTPVAPTGPTTTVEFEETEFNFGSVNAGEKVRHTYTFKNTGDEPLIISNAKGSCGCTVPEWSREPIPVGASGEIVVEFDSKNKKGPRNQKVTITANTDPPQTFIYLKGEVIPAEGTPNVQVNK